MWGGEAEIEVFCSMGEEHTVELASLNLIQVDLNGENDEPDTV